MPRLHPHADASYRVLARTDGGFDVEVSIPDTHPTRVSAFASERDAEAWIAEHRRRVEAQSLSGGRFGKAGARRQSAM